MGGSWTRGLGTELAPALRSLLRRPLVLVASLLTLAPALAASGMGIALVWTAYLRPLPHPSPDRLVVVEHSWAGETTGISTGLHRFYGERARSIERLGIFSQTSVNLGAGGQPRRAAAAQVTAATLELLGARPAIGRLFTEAEDRAGADPTVVLTHELWTESFGADPYVVGRAVDVDGTPRTVVGVLARGTEFHDASPELLLPGALPAESGPLLNIEWWHGLARLAPGASPTAAQQELAELLSRAVVEAPDGRVTPAVIEENGIAPIVTDLFEWQTAAAADFVLLLGATVLLLLVLATAATANLLLGRAEARTVEMRIRRALGAGSGRVLLHVLADSLVVCGASAALGGVAAWTLTRVIHGDPALALPRVDVFWLPAAAAGAACLIAAALVPVLVLVSLGRVYAPPAIGFAAGRLTPGSRLRSALLGAQVAVSTVLLVAGIALGSSVRALAAAPLGFQPEGVLTFKLALPSTASTDEARATHEAIAERLRALPAVTAAGYADGLPVPDSPWTWLGVRVEGHQAQGTAPTPHPGSFVSDGYLTALGLELRAGRLMDAADDESGRRLAVVNESFAERYWGGSAEAIGQRIQMVTGSFEVVGVVTATAHRGPGTAPEPVVFTSRRDAPSYYHPWAVYALRASVPPLDLVAAARAAVASEAPTVPVYDIATLAERVERVNARERLSLEGVAVASGASLLVVAVSLVGLVLLMLLRRRREIGVRKAVGASDRSVRWLLVRGALAPATVGMTAGAAAVVLGLRVPSALLHGGVDATAGVGPTVAAILALVVLSGLLASRGVGEIEPSEALRAD